jgi:hypothetical protein
MFIARWIGFGFMGNNVVFEFESAIVNRTRHVRQLSYSLHYNAKGGRTGTDHVNKTEQVLSSPKLHNHHIPITFVNLVAM